MAGVLLLVVVVLAIFVVSVFRLRNVIFGGGLGKRERAVIAWTYSQQSLLLNGYIPSSLCY